MTARPAHPAVRHTAKALITLNLMIVLAVLVPSWLVSALGYRSLAGIAMLAAVSALLLSLMRAWRSALLIVIPFAIASSLAVVFAHNAWLAALLMALVAGALGPAAERGLNSSLTTIPIAIGFIISTPPSSTESGPSWLLVGIVTIVSMGWAILAGYVCRRWTPTLPHGTALGPRLSRWYGAILAILTGMAAWFVVTLGLGHSGGWLILTIVIVYQPYLQDGFRKALQRAGGTVVGFLVALGIGLVITNVTALLVIGTVVMVIAASLMALRKPYWIYAIFLTIAIVLLEGSGSNLFETDRNRLIATLIGVGVSLVAIILLRPFARSAAQRKGLTHY